MKTETYRQKQIKSDSRNSEQHRKRKAETTCHRRLLWFLPFPKSPFFRKYPMDTLWKKDYLATSIQFHKQNDRKWRWSGRCREEQKLILFVQRCFLFEHTKDQNGSIWLPFLWQKFFQNHIGNPNRLKIHIRGCTWVKYQSFAPYDMNFKTIWIPKVILTKIYSKRSWSSRTNIILNML